MSAALLGVLLAGSLHALDWTESPEIAAVFARAGLRGTFVFYDPAKDSYAGHDQERARKRYVPASTFKIPNTLIGLTAGSVKDVDEMLPYGGKPQPIKDWERDMSLREAIKVSNVPVYQELARRTGLAAMKESLRKLDYGNAEVGGTVDDFWLAGPLEISAVEQAEFLCRLARGTLPFPKEAQERTREIALVEPGLWAKTGWAQAGKPDIGWWVGWVEKDGRPYCFALNIDMPDGSYAPKRMAAGKAALEALRLHAPRAEAPALLGRFSDYVVSEETDCGGFDMVLYRRGAEVTGKFSFYEGGCGFPTERIDRGRYDPETGALSFRAVEAPTTPPGPERAWQFTGALKGRTLAGRFVLRETAGGEEISAKEVSIARSAEGPEELAAAERDNAVHLCAEYEGRRALCPEAVEAVLAAMKDPRDAVNALGQAAALIRAGRLERGRPEVAAFCVGLKLDFESPLYKHSKPHHAVVCP